MFRTKEMGAGKMINILIFLLPFTFAIVVNGHQCCHEGQAIIKRTSYCWEPSTNKTTNISLTCQDTFRKKDGFFVNKEGILELPLNHTTEKVEQSFYCVGNVTTINDVNITQIRAVAIICKEDHGNQSVVLGYCMIISVIFLGLTAFVYTSFKELKDLQGKMIINFCVSLAIGLGIMAFMNLITYSDMNACAARGFLAYFFLIAAFFWTNAISIQVLISTRQPSVADYGWKSFSFYALYAWGCPIILTISMAIVNFHPGDHQKPGIGLNHCWFYNKTQQWYYMYSVMSILIAINICIFIYMSTIIWRHSFSSSHLKAVRYKFLMTLRLFILLGLPWIFEMISSVTEANLIFAISNVFNSLQGLLTFLLLVVFRRRVVDIMYRHGWLNCISGHIEKFLAVVENEEDQDIQHTNVPMTANGHE